MWINQQEKASFPLTLIDLLGSLLLFILALDSIPEFEPDSIPQFRTHIPELVELQINLCNNLMLAFMKIKDYERALKMGTWSMQLNPKNSKTMFRIGQTLYEKGDF